MKPRGSRIALAVLLALLFVPLLPASPAPAQGPARIGPLPTISPASAGIPQPTAALLSFAITSSASQADPKDAVVFTVYFNNTGTQNAPSAWINVTAASGFTFLGDTAAGNVSGYPNFRFSNLPLGLHSFRMTFEVNVGVVPGTRLSITGTLVYADGSGGQQFLGPATASVLVGVVTKPLYLGWGSLTPGILTPAAPTGSLSAQGTFTLTPGGPAVNFDLTPALARSFHASNASAVLYLQPAAPSSLDINLTLIDVNGGATTVVSNVERTYSVTGSGYWTLFYTFPSMNYRFSAGHQIRLQVLSTAGSGQPAFLATNATTFASRLAVQTTSYVSVDSLQPALVPTTYLSPKSSLVVTANVSDPFGSTEVVAAHLNLTGPTGALSGWADPFPVVSSDPSTPSAWIVFQRTFSAPFANGTYAVEVTAVERNGVTDVGDGGAVVRAPSFTLQKIANPDQGKSGTRITYFLWYNNTGSGPAARVWLNDTLPSQVNFQNSSVTPTGVSGNAYSWIFTSVPVGSHVLQIFVQVRGGVSTVSYIRNWASVNYSDPQGFLWPSVKSHADIVINGPVLTLSQSTTPPGTVHSNQPVVFAIRVTNTGDAATKVWLNDTIPSGLVYLSDTAVGAGGVRTVVGNQVQWTFPGMPSGAGTPTDINFTMNVRAAAGLPWGAALRNVIGLNDSSTNGVMMPDELNALALTVASPSFSAASASFDVPSAVPNVGLPVSVNFTNAGNEASGTTWINLTLGPGLRFKNASVPASFASPVLRLTLTSAGIGADHVSLFLAANASVSNGDVLALSGTLAGLDGYGNVLPAVAVARGTVTVALPRVSFSLAPAATSAEAGTTVTYTVTGGNSGSGTASAVWLNLTLPTGLRYVNDTFGAARSGSSTSWVWQDYAPGSHTYSLVLQANPGVADNTSASFSFDVQAFDAGGNPETSSSFGGRVYFVAPAFQLTAWADPNEIREGPPFLSNFTLTARNTGSTMAQALWLTATVDSHLTVVTYDAPVGARGTTTLNWTLPDVTPGQTITIKLQVRVVDGTPANLPLAVTFGAQYTNSGGVFLESLSPATAVVTVLPNWTGLFEILFGGSALGGLVVFVVYRRYRVKIEDVFLIYRDGILVSHLVKGDGLEKDEDQLSGMLTAVQDFVKDAFTYGEHRELHQLEFGDYHVLIERGKLVYLAVVYQGRDSGLIRKRVRTVLDRVESAYGGVFERWDGDMAQVSGTQELLREGFIEDKHPWSLVTSRSA